MKIEIRRTLVGDSYLGFRLSAYCGLPAAPAVFVGTFTCRRGKKRLVYHYSWLSDIPNGNLKYGTYKQFCQALRTWLNSL